MSNLMELIDAYARALVGERHDDCAESSEQVVARVHAVVAARAAVVEAVEKLERDAARYRWLRERHWEENTIAVVIRPKDNTALGSFLPYDALLDDTIDRMSKEATNGQGN